MSWFGWFRKSNGQAAGGDSDRHDGESAPPAPSAEASVGPLPPAATTPPTAAPDEVRRLLFDAVASGDDARLESLCREHKQYILSQLASRLEVPPSFRTSPEAYEWYGNGLRAIAKFCADKVDAPTALNRPDDPAAVAAQPN